MKKPESPCLNCSDRYLGCHSKCDLYDKFKQDIKLLKERSHKEQLKISEWLEYKNHKYRVLSRWT